LFAHVGIGFERRIDHFFPKSPLAANPETRKLLKQRTEALVILASPIFTAQRALLAALAVQHRLPAIYYNEGFTEAGGLLAYGPRLAEFSWQRAAIFVDKILKGAIPADLPIEQPTKFDLVINVRTAKQIGVTIPPSVLARADRVIR
jgi:hypothetical protein